MNSHAEALKDKKVLEVDVILKGTICQDNGLGITVPI